MDNTNLPSKFPIPFANSAGGIYARSIPQASQIAVTPGAASLTDGFPPLTFVALGAGGVPPAGADVNGLFRQITQGVQWNQAGGLYVYDSAFSATIGGYPKGCILAATTHAGLWFNLVDNNTTNPDAGGANWRMFAPPIWTSPASGSLLVSGMRVIPPNEISGVSYTLPLSPLDGDWIQWAQGPVSFSINNLTLQRNGNTIMGLAQDMTVSSTGHGGALIWRASSSTWRVFATSLAGA